MRKMVQDGKFYAPRGYWPEKSLLDDARYSDIGEGKPQGRPLPIQQALRDHCKINAQEYFLATISDDGTTHVFSSAQNHTADYFDEEGFKRTMERAREVERATASAFDMHPSALHELAPPYGGSSHHPFGVDNRWSQRGFGREAAAEDSRPRKRYRADAIYRDLSAAIEEPPVRNTVGSAHAIEVGKEELLWEFYEQRFKDCQQTACKLIAKAWIKTVEPKKQSNHPYTGADERAPDWWPTPWGTAKDEKVRHKEPDHLYKKERVHLLKHILSMVIMPAEQQHMSIQSLGLNVRKLEEVTWEALSGFFADKENPSNERKKKYLEDIFRVARYHQRYKNEEIDSTTMVWVRSNEKGPEDMDTDNPVLSPLKDEDEQDYSRHSSSVSPPKGSTPHSLATHHGSEHAGSGHLQGGSYADESPARGSQYSQQSLLGGLPSDQGQYVDAGMTAPAHLTPGSFMYAASHDSSRRNSMFSPTDYTSPSTPFYSTWSPATTAPSSSSLFAYTSQQNPGPHPHYLDHSPGQLGQSQQYVASEYDGLPRGGSDFGSHLMHRGSLPSQTFSFMSSIPDNLKVESIPRITQP